MNPINRGKFIVFEGGEGAGKSTQIKLIQNHQMKGRPAVFTRQPGGTTLGLSIRGLLLDSNGEPIAPKAELLLYAADRAQHVERCILPALNSGIDVFCDRYADSTMAYQGHGRGIDKGLINQINAIATGGLMPDLTIWIDTPSRVGLERVHGRGQTDRIEGAGLEFHQAVRQGFAEIAQHNATYRWIDGCHDPTTVNSFAWDMIQNCLLSQGN
jgi:dTMP kinase